MIKRLFQVFTVALLATMAPAIADIAVTAELNRDRIYMGESVEIQVRVEGSNSRELDVGFPDLKDASLAFMGSQDSSSRHISIINGRLQQNISKSRIFFYRLTPRRAGLFQAGAVLVKSAKESATAVVPPVNVVGVEPSPDIHVLLRASGDELLVEESFSVELVIRAKSIDEPMSHQEPWHPQRPPLLQSDFLDIQEINGLSQPDMQQLLGGLVSQNQRSSDFHINNYKSQGFGGFLSFGNPFEPQPLRFRLPASRVSLGGTNYWEYKIKLDYQAQNEGSYTFGPVTLKGQYIRDIDQFGSAHMKDVFTVGPAVTVRVSPPPEENRPDSFIGTVGKNVNLKNWLNTSLCKVGDPLTLTIEISGDLSLSNLRPPILDLPSESQDNFRLYGPPFASENIEKGKRFRYRIRPLKAGTLEFPAIPISYFDTEKRAYATLHTQPLPLQAQSTTQISADDSLADDELQSIASLAKSPDGIIITDSDTSDVSSVVASRVFWAVVSLAPLCFLGVGLLRGLWRRRHNWRRRRRSNSAYRLARRSIRGALRRGDSDPTAAAIDGVQALRDYCAARLGGSHSHTTGELRELFERRGIAPAHTAALLENSRFLEQAPFQPGDSAPGEISAALKKLDIELSKLEKAIKNNTADIGRKLSVVILILFSSLGLRSVEAARTLDSFDWERANQQMSQASSPSDFLEAARTYNSMVLDGQRSGALFYNLGTALLMAEDYYNAQAALLRAERHLGGLPEIQLNLRLALARQTNQPEQPLPPSRYLLAWHYKLPLSLRLWLLAVGWCVFWLGMALRLLTPTPIQHQPVSRRRTFTNLLASLGAALVVLYGGSTAFTIVQEQHDTRYWPERVPGAQLPQENPGVVE